VNKFKLLLYFEEVFGGTELTVRPFNLSSLDKGYCRFERFRLALFKNRR